MSVIDLVTGELSRLPGIGPKTAMRLVHHLMKGSKDDTLRLAYLQMFHCIFTSPIQKYQHHGSQRTVILT